MSDNILPEDDKIILCQSESVAEVIDSMFGAFPARPNMLLSEAVERFHQRFPPEDACHNFTFTELKVFLQQLSDICVDRALGRMVDQGKLEMLHDGDQFWFRLPKDSKGTT